MAAFAMLLKQSEYTGNATYAMVRQLAKSSLGADPRGHRAEFLALVSVAEELSQTP